MTKNKNYLFNTPHIILGDKVINLDLFKLLGIELYRDISKPTHKSYIIYEANSKLFISNLTTFDVFDFLKSRYTKELYLLFLDITKLISDDEHIKKLKSDLLSDITSNKIDSTELKFRFEAENKPLYNLFKTILNLKKILINDIDFKPIKERVFEDKGKTILNLYQKINNYSNIKPNSKAQFPHIEKIVRNICGSEIAYEFFLKFLSWKIKNPLILIPTHIIIQDDGGTGKSELLLGDILNSLFEIGIITQDDLMSGFNSFMAKTNLIWCEEVEGFEDEKKLKALTGAKYITLNEKYEKTRKLKNYNNFVVASNELRVMKLTSKDRRWSIIGGGKRLVPLNNNWKKETIFISREDNENFFKGYHKNLKHEIKEFYSYLLSLEFSRNDIQIPLKNNLKNNLIDINKNSLNSFIDEILDTNFNEICREVFPNVKEISENFIFSKENKYYIKFNDFYKLYLGYCKLNQYNKKLSKKVFSYQFKQISETKRIFEDSIPRPIRINNQVNKCLELKTHKNDNIETLKDINEIIL